jgi:hypothetical protein
MRIRHAASLALALVASDAFALTGEKYFSQATVQPVEARKIALETYPGKLFRKSWNRSREAVVSDTHSSFAMTKRSTKSESMRRPGRF